LAYYKALKLRALLRQEVLAALDQADVLVMPTMGSAAPKIEPDPVIDSKERSNRNRAGLTTAFSLASAPALSMCCGFTSEHLPIGLQIGGKPFAEQTVLNVAYAYQHATDWHRRRPPL
jgi:aspartyl-tRNA(Asn)/glutamyl-tRNA(Gln) amidotransferase subunit A